jgi:hypothetical protein
LQYIFVNGISFFDDFIEYKRHNLFEYLLEKDSPLVNYVTIVENKYDKKTQKYVEPRLTFIDWALFFL